MKTIFAALLLLGNICVGQTIINGKLVSQPGISFSIRAGQSALNDYAGVLMGQGKTGSSGEFSCVIDIKKEAPVSLYIGNVFFVFWAKPNTTLTIEEQPGKGYIFSGTTALENELLYASGIMQPFKISPNIGLVKFEPAKQLHYLDSLEAERLSLIKGKEQSVSAPFLLYYNTEASAFSYLNKNQYPALCKTTAGITDKDIPAGYFNFWNSFTLQNDSTESPSYAYALQDFIGYKTLKNIDALQAGTERYWQEIFKTADALLLLHPLSLQKQKTAVLVFLLKHFNYPDITFKEINTYTQQFPSSASLPLINNLWQKKQAAASITPSFRLKNETGQWVDAKDFAGKVVYVDFWGSWCKACIINMPYAQQLKEKLKGKDVVFLYLDFYDTDEKWLTAIKKYGIEGVHLKAEKTDEAYFDKIFATAQGFPRYALLDKKGKLVTISAPAPNDPAAYELIRKYLGE